MVCHIYVHSVVKGLVITSADDVLQSYLFIPIEDIARVYNYTREKKFL